MEIKKFSKSSNKQNLINLKKKKLFLKFSNTTLFGRRELLLQNNQSKNLFSTKTLLKNIDSFPSTSLSTFQTYKTNNNPTKKPILKKSLSSNNYISERKMKNNNIIEKELLNNNIIYNSEEQSLDESEEKNNFFLTLSDNNDKIRNNKDSLYILKNLEKEVIELKKMKKININTDLKLKNLNKPFYGTKKLIKKNEKYKYLQYLALQKKDRIASLVEEYETKTAYFKEMINSSQNALKLFNVKFINKLNNYIKYLDNIRNIEKKKNLMFFKEKMEYKSQIEKISTEIEKLQIKKNKIIKWIYLQIQVKEKKLILPTYYKTIIESNKPEILAMQGKFYDKNNFKRDEKKNISKSNSSKKKKYLMKRSISSLSKNDKNFNLLITKKSQGRQESEKFINNKMLNNNKENSYKTICLEDNNIKEYITKDDFDKILLYKYSPIFKTSEEFKEALKELDSQNLYLLKNYNQIQYKIYHYLNELRDIINSKNKNNIMEFQITEKSKELEKIKNKYKLLYKIYLKNIKPLKLSDSLLYISHNTKKNYKISIKNMEIIYNKIKNISENLKTINNEGLLDLLDYNIKKANTKEGEILYNLEYIECNIDYLLERIKYFKIDKNNNEILQKIIFEIDKKHKQEKPDKQRLEDLEKNLKLLKKIENRNNKMFFVSRRIDLFAYKNRIKKNLNKNKNNENKDNFPTLEEFLNRKFYQP